MYLAVDNTYTHRDTHTINRSLVYCQFSLLLLSQLQSPTYWTARTSKYSQLFFFIRSLSLSVSCAEFVLACEYNDVNCCRFADISLVRRWTPPELNVFVLRCSCSISQFARTALSFSFFINFHNFFLFFCLGAPRVCVRKLQRNKLYFFFFFNLFLFRCAVFVFHFRLRWAAKWRRRRRYVCVFIAQALASICSAHRFHRRQTELVNYNRS